MFGDAGTILMTEAAETTHERLGFDEAFTLYHRVVFRVARNVTGNEAQAEDVVQEVFLKLYKNIDDVPAGELLKAWLIRVALNAAKNAVRGNSRATVREDNYFKETGFEAETTHPEILFERRQEIAAAQRALVKIREPMRSCLILKQQGLSYREIAAALSVNEASVGTFVARGRQEFIRFYGKTND